MRIQFPDPILKLIAALLVLLPLLVLGKHYWQDRQHMQAAGSGSSQIDPYATREWRRIVLGEIFICCGLFLNLYLRHTTRNK